MPTPLSHRRYPGRGIPVGASWAPFLFNAGPYLLGLCAVGVFLLRGCLNSISLQALLQAMATNAVPGPLLLQPATPPTRTMEAHSAVVLGAGGRSTYVPGPESTPVPSMLIADEGPENDVAEVTVQPRMPMGGFFGNPTPVPWMGTHVDQTSMPTYQQPMFPNMLQDASAAPRSMSFDECPLFDSKRGRKFTGTSQMPGEASKRISLSIGAIRERGKNVEARLSTLEGQRFTREYTGTLQQNPLKLVLTPVTNPRSFGTFVTYMPWYSNSPTKIELSLDLDGKMLLGTSVSGEEFELLAQPDRSANVRGNQATPRSETLEGFDDPSKGATRWMLKSASDDSHETTFQAWEFHHQEDGKGGFKWYKDGRIIASGRYAEDPRKGHLDIALKVNGSSVQYLARFKPKQSGDELEVCVPHHSADERPATISAKEGKVYLIQRVDKAQP